MLAGQDSLGKINISNNTSSDVPFGRLYVSTLLLSGDCRDVEIATIYERNGKKLNIISL